MAAPTTSAALTALNQAQAEVQSVHQWNGRIRRKCVFNHTIPFTASAIADRHAMLRFNSGDTLISVVLYCDGAATAGDADIGFYQANGGAVVDADAIVAAVAIDTLAPGATGARVDQMANGAVYDETNRHLPLWDVHTALTADPFVQYDMEFTITTAVTVADAVVGLDVFYVSGD